MDRLLELLDDGITGWLGGLLGRDRGPSWQGTVPNLHGLPEGVARRTLSDCDLCIELVRLTEHPATVEEVVVDQSPAPGERVDRRSTVTIYLQSRQVTHGPHAKGSRE